MAKKTRTQLAADASNVNILDNTSQQVTPAKVRTQYTDERDSVINYVDDFTGSVGDLLTIGTDGESITWIPVSDVQTPPGGSTGDIQINAGGGNFGATTDIVITSGDVSIPNGNLSVEGDLSLESSLPILSLRDTDTINSAGSIYFKDGTNTIKAQIGYNATDGFDFTTTSSFTFDGGDADFGGNLTASDATFSGEIDVDGSFIDLGNGGTNGRSALLSSTASSAVYLSNVNTGTAPFDQKGSLIIQPRSDAAGRSVAIATGNGGSEAVAMLIDDSQNATFSGNVGVKGATATFPLNVLSTTQQVAVDIEGQNATATILNIDNENANSQSFIRFQTEGARSTSIGFNDNLNVIGISHTAGLTAPDFYIDNSGDATFSGNVTIQGNDLIIGNGLANDLDLSSNVATLPTNTQASPFVWSSTGAGGGANGDLIIGARMNAANRDIRFYSSTDGTSDVTEMLNLDPTNGATFSGDLALSAYGSGSKTGTATYALGVDGSGNVVETSNAITASGTYIPTVSNLVNISSTQTRGACYFRIGNIVYVQASIEFVASSTTQGLKMELSLPIASNLFSTSLRGSGVAQFGYNGKTIHVRANTTNNYCQCWFMANSTSTDRANLNFWYDVI